jgi:hypothetical protein
VVLVDDEIKGIEHLQQSMLDGPWTFQGLIKVYKCGEINCNAMGKV